MPSRRHLLNARSLLPIPLKFIVPRTLNPPQPHPQTHSHSLHRYHSKPKKQAYQSKYTPLSIHSKQFTPPYNSPINPLHPTISIKLVNNLRQDRDHELQITYKPKSLQPPPDPPLCNKTRKPTPHLHEILFLPNPTSTQFSSFSSPQPQPNTKDFLLHTNITEHPQHLRTSTTQLLLTQPRTSTTTPPP